MSESTIRFLVQGSAEEPYVVTFSRNGDNLTARCNCVSAHAGNQCKHRIQILYGITDHIVSGNEHEVRTVGSWLSGTDVESAIRRHFLAECACTTAKAELSAARIVLGKALND